MIKEAKDTVCLRNKEVKTKPFAFRLYTKLILTRIVTMSGFTKCRIVSFFCLKYFYKKGYDFCCIFDEDSKEKRGKKILSDLECGAKKKSKVIKERGRENTGNNQETRNVKKNGE